MQIHSTRSKLMLLLVTTGYLLFSFVIIEYLHSNYLRNAEADNYQRLSGRLSLLRAKIEALVNSEVFLSDSLSTLITFAPESTLAQWEQVAMQLKNKGPHILNIGVAPNDVLSFIYPLEGNERAMGLDFRDNPAQWDSVQQARVMQKIFIQGPFKLIQGNKAIIGRMPIFSDPPFNHQYWGHCSVVINIESLLLDAGIKDIDSNLELAIRGVDGKGSHGNIFYGKDIVFDKPLMTEEVHILNGSWIIGLKQAKQNSTGEITSWAKHNMIRLIGFAVAISFLLSFIAILQAYRLANRASLHDALTHLPNRRFAMSILEQLQQGSFSIISIDLNRFKIINDTYGHAVGDAFLIEVAKRILSTLRSSDTIARLGGDEFLIILPRVTERDSINKVINKLEKHVCELPFRYQDTTLDVCMSMGVARYPQDASTLSDLLHFADEAMYLNKQQKREE